MAVSDWITEGEDVGCGEIWCVVLRLSNLRYIETNKIKNLETIKLL